MGAGKENLKEYQQRELGVKEKLEATSGARKKEGQALSHTSGGPKGETGMNSGGEVGGARCVTGGGNTTKRRRLLQRKAEKMLRELS